VLFAKKYTAARKILNSYVNALYVFDVIVTIVMAADRRLKNWVFGWEFRRWCKTFVLAGIPAAIFYARSNSRWNN